jgi:hypothetical protein
MHILQKHIDFVNDQIKHYDRMCYINRAHPDKLTKYKEVASKLRELLIYLELASENSPSKTSDTVIKPSLSSDKSISSKLPPNFLNNPLALSSSDYAGLEDDILKELNISESDKIEATIIELINAAGGTLILDKIILGLFHLTGEKHQRIPLTARLYRMGKKDLVFSVPKKKGVYTTIPLEDEHTSNDEEVIKKDLF